jgi:hypothetical protein
MSTSTESNPKPNELSSQSGPAISAANDPTVSEIGNWDVDKLLEWAQQKISLMHNAGEIARFLKARINGRVFLKGAGDRKFFQDAGISFGASVELAELASETISRKSKYYRLHHTLHATAS